MCRCRGWSGREKPCHRRAARCSESGLQKAASNDAAVCREGTILAPSNTPMKSSVICVAIAIGAVAAGATAGHSTSMSTTTGAGEGHMSTATHIRMSDDVAAIRALEDSFAAALNAGDVDAMMKHYV